MRQQSDHFMRGTRLDGPRSIDQFIYPFQVDIASQSIPFEDLQSILQQIATINNSYVSLRHLAVSKGKTIALIKATVDLKKNPENFYIHQITMKPTTPFKFEKIVNRLKLQNMKYEDFNFAPENEIEDIESEEQRSQDSENQWQESFINDQHESSHEVIQAKLVRQDLSQFETPLKRLRKVLPKDEDQFIEVSNIENYDLVALPSFISKASNSTFTSVEEVIKSFTKDPLESFISKMRNLVSLQGQQDQQDCYSNLERLMKE